jgi:hypothetical protein
MEEALPSGGSVNSAHTDDGAEPTLDSSEGSEFL